MARSTVVDGRHPASPAYPRGHFVKPTVLDRLPLSSAIAQTEIFGPVLSLHHVDTLERGDRHGQRRRLWEPGLVVHLERRPRPAVSLRGRSRQCRHQRRRRRADGVLSVQRRAGQLFR